MVQAREGQELREIFGAPRQRSGLESFVAANQGNPPLSLSNTSGSAPSSVMGDPLVTEPPVMDGIPLVTEPPGAQGIPLVSEPPLGKQPPAVPPESLARSTQDRYIGDLSEQQVLRLASMKNPQAQQLLKAYFDIKAGRRENIKILPNGTLVDLSDPGQVEAYQRRQESQALAQAKLINPDGTMNQDALRVFIAGATDPFKAVTDASAASVAIRRVFGNVKDEATPFDALISLSDSLGTQGPTIKSHAERLASQYRKGLIPEDRANTLAQQMIDGATRYMDMAERRRVDDQYREDRLAILNQNVQNTQAYRESMQALQRELAEGRRQDEAARLEQRKTEEERRAQDARDRMEERRQRDAIAQGIDRQRLELERERLDRVKKENEGKLTDEQKMVFRSNVLPIINEGTKAQTAITQLGALEDKINKAPSGVFAGTMARSVGALFGTDANTALRELESLSKGLIPTIPRLPGAASNLDSQNLEASLGKLYDPTLTNEQRRELVKTIRQTYQKLYDRALRVEDTWNSSKTFNMRSLDATPPPSSTQDQRYRVIR